MLQSRRMKLLLFLCLFLTGCQQIERYMNWQHYKETAIREGLVPLHPEELYPETPERGYMFDSAGPPPSHKPFAAWSSASF